MRRATKYRDGECIDRPQASRANRSRQRLCDRSEDCNGRCLYSNTQYARHDVQRSSTAHFHKGAKAGDDQNQQRTHSAQHHRFASETIAQHSSKRRSERKAQSVDQDRAECQLRREIQTLLRKRVQVAERIGRYRHRPEYEKTERRDAPGFQRRRRECSYAVGLLQRFWQVTANVQTNRHDRRTEQKGDAPSPRLQRFGGQQTRQDECDDPRRQNCNTLRRLLNRCIQRASVRWRRLYQECSRWSNCAAKREALQRSEKQEQNRCGNANLSVRRGNREPNNADTHERQRQHHRWHSAHSVCVVTNDDCADGAGEESETEEGQREQRSCRRLGCREEGLSDLRCEERKDDEVVEHESIADADGKHLAKR